MIEVVEVDCLVDVKRNQHTYLLLQLIEESIDNRDCRNCEWESECTRNEKVLGRKLCNEVLSELYDIMTEVEKVL